MSDLVERLRAPSSFQPWCGSDGLFVEAADEIEHLQQQIASSFDRIAALEALVCVYADPTGADKDEHDLIMSCHDWWKDEQTEKKT